jgi:hypothetical protein
MSPLKGTVDPDIIPVNKFQLLVAGLPPLTFTSVGGIEDELQTAELPDRQRVSGGNRGPIEFTAMLPEHHLVEQGAMELWFKSSQDPVSPSYRKIGTLVVQSNTGSIFRTYSLLNLFPTKRALPDREMENEGEMSQVEWTFSADDIEPI